MKTTLFVKNILTSKKTNCVYHVVLTVETGDFSTDILIYRDTVDGTIKGPELKTCGFEVCGDMIRGAAQHFSACESFCVALSLINFADAQLTVINAVSTIVNNWNNSQK